MSQAFSGSTYNHKRDYKRLHKGLVNVLKVLQDYRWHTIEELAARCGIKQTSASARIRDLRKSHFGGWEIEKQHVKNGLWHYRLKRDKK